MEDRLEKSIELQAPVSQVWHALTDCSTFNKWFRVRLAHPFVPGHSSRGPIAYPGYEQYVLEINVQRMVPESLFSFTWLTTDTTAADGPNAGLSQSPTHVEFQLKPVPQGTALCVVESGFAKILDDTLRIKTRRVCDAAWTGQILKNLKLHVGG